MDKTSWDKVKWRLIGNHLDYSKFDVGIQCGGWGKVIVEISMREKG